MALAFLCEAYDEEHLTDSKGKEDIRTVPVSYTHLDVYKRQGPRRTLPGPGGTAWQKNRNMATRALLL